MSFTYPEYVLDNFRYIVGREKALNISLTSRATGMTATCSGDVAGAQDLVRLACTASPNPDAGSDDLPDRSTIAVEFDPGNKVLQISHSWICGDTKGLSS
jgi:hypothetical protein